MNTKNNTWKRKKNYLPLNKNTLEYDNYTFVKKYCEMNYIYMHTYIGFVCCVLSEIGNYFSI